MSRKEEDTIGTNDNDDTISSKYVKKAFWLRFFDFTSLLIVLVLCWHFASFEFGLQLQLASCPTVIFGFHFVI